MSQTNSQLPPKKSPVPPKAMEPQNLMKGNEWVDARLSHYAQRRRYQACLFWFASFICVLLYAVFFGAILLLLTHTIALQAFFAHKHSLALILSLLIVPSAMLWGLVRAVFRVEPSQQKYTDIIKEGIALHPLG